MGEAGDLFPAGRYCDTVFLNFAAQLPFQQPALELLRLDIFGIFLDFVPLWVSCILLMLLGVADLLSAKRQRRQLESEGLDPYRLYPKGLRARFRGLLRSYWFTYGIFAAALIIAVALGAGGSRVTERMPASQLPGAVYASAEELFPGGEDVDAQGYGWRATLSSPLLFIHQELLDAEGRRRQADTQYYGARWEWLAEKALAERLEEWRVKYGDREPVQIETGRADEVWKLNWGFRWCVAARKGGQLLFIEVW